MPGYLFRIIHLRWFVGVGLGPLFPLVIPRHLLQAELAGYLFRRIRHVVIIFTVVNAAAQRRSDRAIAPADHLAEMEN